MLRLHLLTFSARQWGRNSATNSDWYQRIIQEDNNTVSWEYNWAGSSSSVKGYPVVMAGWHSGNPGGWMTSSGQKGFPSKISANRSYNTSASVSHSNAGTYREVMNLSWDVWIAWSSSPSAPGNEVMVWPWRVSQRPIGSRVGTVSLWGANWDPYSGQASSGSSSWYVFSFLRTSQTLSTGGNLRDFITNVRNRGWLSASQWIVGCSRRAYGRATNLRASASSGRCAPATVIWTSRA